MQNTTQKKRDTQTTQRNDIMRKWWCPYGCDWDEVHVVIQISMDDL